MAQSRPALRLWSTAAPRGTPSDEHHVHLAKTSTGIGPSRWPTWGGGFAGTPELGPLRQRFTRHTFTKHSFLYNDASTPVLYSVRVRICLTRWCTGGSAVRTPCHGYSSHMYCKQTVSLLVDWSYRRRGGFFDSGQNYTPRRGICLRRHIFHLLSVAHVLYTTTGFRQRCLTRHKILTVLLTVQLHIQAPKVKYRPLLGMFHRLQCVDGARDVHGG